MARPKKNNPRDLMFLAFAALAERVGALIDVEIQLRLFDKSLSEKQQAMSDQLGEAMKAAIANAPKQLQEPEPTDLNKLFGG